MLHIAGLIFSPKTRIDLTNIELLLVSYEEIENSYFLHYSVKSQALFMSFEIKFNLNGMGRISS